MTQRRRRRGEIAGDDGGADEQTLTIDRRGHGASELGGPLLNPGASRPGAPPRADACAPGHAYVGAIPGRDVVSASLVGGQPCVPPECPGKRTGSGLRLVRVCVWQPGARRVWAHGPRRTALPCVSLTPAQELASARLSSHRILPTRR